MPNTWQSHSSLSCRRWIPSVNYLTWLCLTVPPMFRKGSGYHSKVSPSHCHPWSRAFMFSVHCKYIQRAKTGTVEDLHCHCEFYSPYLSLSTTETNMSFSSPPQCRNIFGLTRHSEHAMFKECSIEHFGKEVGFTKPSETQFGGNLIAALQLLRLKQALLMCVSASPSLSRRKSIEKLYWYFKRNAFGTMCLLSVKLSIQLCN